MCAVSAHQTFSDYIVALVVKIFQSLYVFHPFFLKITRSEETIFLQSLEEQAELEVERIQCQMKLA